ncbi:hypothetical protein MC7420_8058 [Coleofasciculus chthonoplastes PCC 7420]|uniref:Uncharacterized protein n=1 Tax=Coleofasciculus chthonoplastes PCC 7420 TaxID=118168 RepID=B4VJ76_9CYAN|nr:hypothetical protein [Coleofasciculus chthonoplastes]EDX78320.1 hypothetical protein MC7420_8058 [Coleofasciculus chthonoplastes PCC 7420]
MSAPSLYWTLIRLDPIAGCKREVIPAAKTFCQTQFPQFVYEGNVPDKPIQRQLIQWSRGEESTDYPEFSTLAQLCLRCFVSRQIELKQHRELNRFLLEQGVYLISDWAILNDTTPNQLSRIYRDFHHLTDREIQQARILLRSYHSIYRRDRNVSQLPDFRTNLVKCGSIPSLTFLFHLHRFITGLVYSFILPVLSCYLV